MSLHHVHLVAWVHAVHRRDRAMRVLVAEDDNALRSVLERGLRENGYVVDSVGDGSAALRHLRAYEYDVAILDWRMPAQTGLEVIDEVRRAGDRTPILMLTARDTASDRVTGLDTGADDYLVKPFEISELFARIRALQRRPPLTTPPVLACGDLLLDPATRVVSVAGHPVAATAIETSLIELLLRRSPTVVTRRTIALQVWNDEADAVGSNTIDVHVARVRSKLSGGRARIETVRGLGYRMCEG
jgi:DNA-binding response OmpR family regulator